MFMKFLRYIKRSVVDVPQFLIDMIKQKMRFSNKNPLVIEFNKYGLVNLDELILESDVVELNEIFDELLENKPVPKSGQSTGRFFTNGVLDPRLGRFVDMYKPIASEYLGIKNPHQELMYLQESFPQEDIENIPGGQFHLDDNKTNIKFFIYLSDVGESNGPFMVMPESHNCKDKNKFFRYLNWALTKNRSALYITDSNQEAELEKHSTLVLGSRGTCFVADTTAWHKAKPVLEGTRRVFVVSFNRK